MLDYTLELSSKSIDLHAFCGVVMSATFHFANYPRLCGENSSRISRPADDVEVVNKVETIIWYDKHGRERTEADTDFDQDFTTKMKEGWPWSFNELQESIVNILPGVLPRSIFEATFSHTQRTDMMI